jgi:hypothetical protein
MCPQHGGGKEPLLQCSQPAGTRPASPSLPPQPPFAALYASSCHIRASVTLRQIRQYTLIPHFLSFNPPRNVVLLVLAIFYRGWVPAIPHVWVTEPAEKLLAFVNDPSSDEL